MRAAVAGLGLAAAGTPMIQAIAAAGVAAAVQGAAVAPWCVALATAATLRALVAWRCSLLVQGQISASGLSLAESRLLQSGRRPPAMGELAASGRQRLQMLRLGSDIAGLALGALLVCLWAHPLLAVTWGGACLAAAATCRPRPLSRRGSRRDEQRRDMDLRTLIARHTDLRMLGLLRHLRRRIGGQPETVKPSGVGWLPLISGCGQAAVAVGAACMVAGGWIELAVAIAAIIATTTAAARCDGAAGWLAAWEETLLAGRSLGRPAALLASTQVPTSGRGAALSLGLPGRDPLLLQAGASVAIVGPPGALAGVAATLAGHGGAVALACDGRSLTPGDTDAWHARVATVGHRDALLGPTLRDDLDGDGRHGSFAMVAWLHACGAGSLATRLEQPSGGLWSGGERRRICLARALAARPGLLVLEDPSAPLDPVAAAALLRVLSHPRRRCTIVVLGCDAAVAAACQRVVVLADQPDEGTAAEILARPQHHRWLREEAA